MLWVGMRIRDTLEQLGLTQLAVCCRKVSESPSLDSATREEALELQNEWASLGRATSARSIKEQQELRAEEEALKSRMIDFLAGLFAIEGDLPFEL
jgi:hypothetical protein